jgi:hypothetical protein
VARVATETKIERPDPALTKKQRIESLRNQMLYERETFKPHWRELNNFVSPRKARFQIDDNNKMTRRVNEIINSSATFALRTLSAGMMGGLTSPARPWFKLTTPDPDLAEFKPVKEYLHVTVQRMLEVFLKSNVYKILPTYYSDLGLFGTAGMGVFGHPKRVIHCRHFPIGSFTAANDEDLEVKVFSREFQLSVRQVVEKFVPEADRDDVNKWRNISQTTKDLWNKGSYEVRVDIVHVISPNTEYAGDSMVAGRFKKYYSCYYERGSKGKGGGGFDYQVLPGDNVFLQEGGFDNFPVLVSRWEVSGEDIYATNSPGMVALGDIKELQLKAKRLAQALDKIVSPPMTAPTALKNGRPTVLPSDITYYDVRTGMKGFEPAYQIDPKALALNDAIDRIEFRIRRAFYEDMFLMMASNPALDTGDKTAREIEERHEEKLLALGPVLGNLDHELLNPLIDITYSHMERQGLLPDPPEELQGQDLRVEYLSLMAVAQKMVGLGGLERFASFGVNIAKLAGKPEILDKINFDEVFDEHALMTGVPPRVVVSDDEVKAVRDRRAKIQEAAQGAQTLKDASAGVKNLAGAPTSGGSNALADLLGSAQQQGSLPAGAPANAPTA